MEKDTLAVARQLLRDTIAWRNWHEAQPQQCCMWPDGRVEERRLEAIWLLHNNPRVLRDIYRDAEGGYWRCVGQPEAFRVTDEGRAWTKGTLAQATELCKLLRADDHSSSDGKAFVPCSAEELNAIIERAAPEVVNNLGDALQAHAERAAALLAKQRAQAA